ncbi:MAG: hypothetical protein ACK4ND_16210, partial [Cytophagaceae bacterium]
MNLSPEEHAVISEKEYLIVKQQAIKKISDTLLKVGTILYDDLNIVNFPFPIKKTTKISKGENYRNLPYLVLDFPSYYQKNGFCMFRSLFLWGYGFSVELVISGDILARFKDQVYHNLRLIKENDYFICHGPTPWNYYYETDNYIPLGNVSDEKLYELIHKREFVKLGTFMPLECADELERFIYKNFLSM